MAFLILGYSQTITMSKLSLALSLVYWCLLKGIFLIFQVYKR
ncbi:hypothetical protein HJ01_00967 [Flavobacterium frigoris PS1]|uniref:Uncharacterized protein n=1 Tax=Flavobacterium frigoris (strain PS1) TaxID=1086011 RepID=H7FP69_FLAFP|nr:hypothetical protein HJ01_00967 [Flavobacterium frigoris PS1]